MAVALSLLAVFATTALATTVVSLRNSGVLHVSVLDVGQGDAVLIRTPQGRQVLVDGGPNPLTLEQRLAEEVPWWSRRLDLVVLTHGQADHVGGLPDLLERRPVRAVLEPGLDAGNVPYLRWRDALVDGDPPVFRAAAATRVDLGGGVWLEVLHPPSQPIRSARSDLDDNSIVLRLTYGQATFLLPGDIFSGGESYLVAQGAPLRATVLKVPHHGSANASTAPFLEAVSPQVAVVSSGVENPFGHPSDEALSRLTARVGEDRLFRTDRHGTVRFTTDGKRLWVRTVR